MKSYLTSLSAPLLAAALALPATAQAIQLRTGEVLVGEVVDATSDGLSFRRLDTGGFLELDWDDLSTLHAARIKHLKGLVVSVDDEPTIEADVIVHTSGGGLVEELVGLIDWGRSTPNELVVRTKGNLIPVKRNSQNLKNIRKREVPVLEVYTAKEWYELKLQEIAPADDADKHIALAEQMRRVGEYQLARKHLDEAERLGGGAQASSLPIMQQRIANLIESTAERELLAQIRIMRNRSEFDKAEQLMEEFRQKYPDSKLADELAREAKRFDAALAEHAVQRLRRDWDTTIRRVANDKVAERGLTLAEARSYAEGKMVDDVFARLSKSLEITPEELKQFWAQREEHGRGRAEIFSYGVGSWVLGEEAIIAGTKLEDGASGDSGGEVTAEDRELERIIRKLREHRDQRRRAGGGGGQGAEETDEDWWRDASREQRTGWLGAYFAEFGGQMQITNAYAEPCAVCEGLGYMVEIGDTGGEQRVKCGTCHGTKFTRLFRAR